MKMASIKSSTFHITIYCSYCGIHARPQCFFVGKLYWKNEMKWEYVKIWLKWWYLKNEEKNWKKLKMKKKQYGNICPFFSGSVICVEMEKIRKMLKMSFFENCHFLGNSRILMNLGKSGILGNSWNLKNLGILQIWGKSGKSSNLGKLGNLENWRKSHEIYTHVQSWTIFERFPICFDFQDQKRRNTHKSIKIYPYMTI